MKKRLTLFFVIAFVLLALLLVSCGKEQTDISESAEPEKAVGEIVEGSLEDEVVGDETAELSVEEEAEKEEEPSGPLNGKVVVIDAGHQQTGNSEKEPIGPGASEMKAKVSSGTAGKASGLAEYELTLTVALQLGEELENRGCTVIYTRTTNDVNISNSERAAIANNANADAFVRIHADGSEDSSIHGAMTICQTTSNPYNAYLHDESYELSKNILDSLVESTGCRRQRVWETDTMSGINWCTVPTTIVEMGYMTNPEEDLKMTDSEYQVKIVKGVAEGIEKTLVK